MRVLNTIVFCVLGAAAVAAVPLSPKPMKQSAAEIAFDSALVKQGDATKRVILAKSYLERYPKDVPLGQTAADVIYSSSMNKAEAVAYLRNFAEAHPRDFGPQYYYAYAADDTLVWGEKARRVLAKDSTNFWAWLTWANAEWRKQTPDLDTVATRLEKAVMLDPSRPEGYLSLGDVYMEKGDWQPAVDAYRAGLVCDPVNNILRLRLEDAQDRVRKADKAETK
jgi:tetratricopeptide (TPR) repeat protein